MVPGADVFVGAFFVRARAPRRPFARAGAARAGKNSETVQQTATLAGDAAGILERDYGIDAGEVLSMNVDTVETVTGGIEATSPNFADVVNSWEKYAQKTFSAAFGDKNGNILEHSDGTRVTALPSDGQVTTQAYVLAKYPESGASSTRTVVGNVPAGKTAEQILSEYGLTGVIFSDVAKSMNGRADNGGWWGTAIFNPDEYDADNINAKFKAVQGGSLNDGFCFNVTQNESITYVPVTDAGQPYNNSIKAHPISGYFFNVSHHGDSTQHALFKAENWRLDNSFGAYGGMTKASGNSALWCNWGQSQFGPFNGSPNSVTTNLGEKLTYLASWTDDGKDIDYEVDCRDGRIQIWNTDNGVKRKVADVYDDQFQKGTYGFWGNNCEQKGQAQISNLNVEISKMVVKSFGDIVYEPTWTDGALHMLINIDTKADKT